MESSTLTQRQRDAVLALDDAVRAFGGNPVSSAEFALHFWPGKTFRRGNGPWGLGPDSSGRHGGRMLATLERLGLVHVFRKDKVPTSWLSPAGKRLRDELRKDDSA